MLRTVSTVAGPLTRMIPRSAGPGAEANAAIVSFEFVSEVDTVTKSQFFNNS